MVRRQRSRIVLALLMGISVIAQAQSGSSISSSTGTDLQSEVAAHLPSAPSASVARTYAFPDGKQQFHNYLYSAFGPPGFISAAVGAGLEQNKPAPPERDSGAKGYADPYGSRFATQLLTQTTASSLAP